MTMHTTRLTTALVVIAAATAGCPGCEGVEDVPDTIACPESTFALGRLNRREIDASLQQSFGDTVAPARLFVADSVPLDAFDNTIEALSISPRLVQDLEAAMPRVVDELWAKDGALLASGGGGNGGGSSDGLQTLPGSAAQSSVGAARDTAWNLWSDGEARYTFELASAGNVDIVVRAWGEQAGDALPHMDVWINGTMRSGIDVSSTSSSAPSELRVSSNEAAGTLVVGVRFTNDLFDEASGLDRNLLIAGVDVQGTASSGAPSTTRDPAVRVCIPGNANEEVPCAERIIRAMARQAWRRVASDDEVTGLVGLYNETRADGDSFDDATKLALAAILTSPNFLMRTEAVFPADGAASPEAVAARLSFFLWGGPPDAELAATVDDGSILDDSVLEAQITRMLANTKAHALRKNLVSQWFESTDVASFSLDPGLFPGVNQTVMEAAQRQMDAYIEEFFFGDHDVLEAIDAPVTFVDPALAQFLGLPSTSSEMERVELAADDVRAGILGQSAPSIVTSTSTETNPPRRAKWVLERLMCQTIPLPLGLDIPPVPQATPEQPTARDRLEILTSPNACQTCHDRLNPIGFGLENYGADSRYRTTDHGADIDASGVFRGQSFTTPQELVQIIKHDPDTERCVVEKTLAFAIGRRLKSDDDASIDALLPAFRDGGRRYVELVAAVAKSPLVTGQCGVPGAASDDDGTGGDDTTGGGGAEGEGEGEAPAGEGEGEGEAPGPSSGEGFESGLPSGWQVTSPDCSGTGTATVVDGGAHGGSKRLEVVGGGGYCDHVFVDIPLTSSTEPMHVRFFMQINEALGQSHVTFATLPGADGSDLRLGGQAGIIMWNRESDDATLPGLGPVGIAASTTFVPNQWTCVEFTIDGAAGTMSTSIDGEVVDALVLDGVSTPELDEQWLRNGPWTTSPQSLRLGWEAYGGDVRTLSYDDVVVSSAPIGCQ
jgi:hypothetical protein